MAAAAPPAAESSRSGASADSYIGSLISLTSKCEIRYEGVLYNINTEESSIGLRNVRSFGTEGRKKDGGQIPPSDKIYDYILFRGSDIKDLQVKSSPPPVPSIHNDPAIIQSHYPRPTATSISMPSVGGGAIPDLTSHAGQMGIARAPFQGGLPLYQPGGSLGSWGSSPSPPTADGSGLGLPMYWQGFYPPPGGLSHMQQPPSGGLPHMQQPPSGVLPHMQQPNLLRPPPGLSIPQSVPQPLQYPGLNASFPSISQNLSGPIASVSGSTESGVNTMSSTPSNNLPELPYSLLPPINSALNPSLLSSSTLSSTTAPQQATMLASEKPSTLAQNRAPTVLNTIASVSTVIPAVSKVESISAPVSNVPKPIAGPSLNYQPVSQPLPSNISLPSSNPTEITIPSLVTPGQLLHSSSSIVSSSQPLQTAPKEVDVKAAAQEPPKLSSSEPKASPSEPVVSLVDSKEPILPTPPNQKGSVLHGPTQHNFRGRGRGRGNGYARPVTKFTEDFDFTAMNEKFNKDEVWGHLGKSKVQTRDVDEDEDDFLDEDYTESLRPDKPVYVKDDFFDSLSCNALDHGNRNGRTKFSEQMKIDTETFGDFHRYRGRGGGRGYRGGSRGRGGYGYGRGGYGYGGRGRGYPAPNRAS